MFSWIRETLIFRRVSNFLDLPTDLATEYTEITEETFIKLCIFPRHDLLGKSCLGRCMISVVQDFLAHLHLPDPHLQDGLLHFGS